jgi:hypothetical protein
MGTTTNNGWPTPVATDLVKDGWEAIKDLGDAIDTTLGVYAPSTSGLTLINTTSFSGVTSVSLAADTFTSTYNDYKLIFQMTTYGTDGNITARMRAAGVDSSASSYSNGVFQLITSGTSSVFSASKAGTQWALVSGDSASSISAINGTYDIIAPKLSSFTAIKGFTSGVTTDAAEFVHHYNSHLFQNTTSFDSLSLIFPGTSSGRYSVYGYNK